MTARNDHELYNGYLDRGVKAAQNRDEAMALAKLLRGEQAYLDPKHPSHEIVKRDMKALYDNFVPNEPDVELVHIGGRAVVLGQAYQLSHTPAADPEALTRRWNAGAAPESFSPVERLQLRQMMVGQPGYRDASHPDHAAFVHDATKLYELDAPKAE